MICQNEYHITYGPIACTFSGVHCHHEKNKKECPDFRNALPEEGKP